MLDSGPALILAGPGSGKTYVLTHHIKYLIDKGVKPSSILVITFTKAAAGEMRSRFQQLAPEAANQVIFGTFHSVFLRLINNYSNVSHNLISVEERERLILSITGAEDTSETFGNRISFYKSLSLSDNFLLADSKETSQFYSCLEQYNSYLVSHDLIDFDDILINFNKLIKTDKKVLDSIQRKLLYVCIDEFQDINPIQYDSIKTLFSHTGNIYCVGDEDQAIYGFRGASPEFMKTFLKDFKAVRIVELINNYRTDGAIIEKAANLINENPGRLKTINQKCINFENGKHFHLNVFTDTSKERFCINEDILNELSKGSLCAILLRTNKEAQEYRTALLSYEKNFSKTSLKDEIYGSVNLYLNYLLFKRMDVFQKIMNIPDRTLPDSVSFLNENDMKAFIRKNAGNSKAQKLSLLLKQLKMMENFTPFSLVMYLKNIVGLEQYFLFKYPCDEGACVKTTFNEILDISKNCADLKELSDCFNERTGLAVNINDLPKKNLTVLTFHKSKGLEFDAVFLPDVVEGRVPSAISSLECNIEEERRLFYVAMTRAKKDLYIYTIKNEESGGLLPSRFLKNML